MHKCTMPTRVISFAFAGLTAMGALVAASGGALACQNQSHSAVAQSVLITVDNKTGSPVDVVIETGQQRQDSETAIAGKSVSWSDSIGASDQIQYTTKIGNRSDADFKVINSGSGTKFEQIGTPGDLDCDRDWGGDVKRWKVTYTVK